MKDWIRPHFRCTIVDVLLKWIDLLLFVDAISTLLNPLQMVHETCVRTHNGEVDDVV